jgi:hypothetical protein
VDENCPRPDSPEIGYLARHDRDARMRDAARRPTAALNSLADLPMNSSECATARRGGPCSRRSRHGRGAIRRKTRGQAAAQWPPQLVLASQKRRRTGPFPRRHIE